MRCRPDLSTGAAAELGQNRLIVSPDSAQIPLPVHSPTGRACDPYFDFIEPSLSKGMERRGKVVDAGQSLLPGNSSTAIGRMGGGQCQGVNANGAGGDAMIALSLPHPYPGLQDLELRFMTEDDDVKTKTDLIRELIEKGFSHRKARKAVNGVFYCMARALRRGDVVDIPGGAINTTSRADAGRWKLQRFRNIQTDKPFFKSVKRPKRIIRFKPDKNFQFVDKPKRPKPETVDDREIKRLFLELAASSLGLCPCGNWQPISPVSMSGRRPCCLAYAN
jgi:nucleoid DNA-binding protein